MNMNDQILNNGQSSDVEWSIPKPDPDDIFQERASGPTPNVPPIYSGSGIASTFGRKWVCGFNRW